MIRINLIKKEKRGISIPSISLARLRTLDVKELAKDRAILIIPAVGVLLIGAELFYAFRLKQEISSLQTEVSRLTSQRNSLKKKADVIRARRKALQNEINAVKLRIRNLQLSKDVILALKGYYEPFNGSLSYLYSYVPSTIWFNSLSQSMDFQKVNVDLSFGSYDINSIKNFFTIVKKEFPEVIPSEIKKQENKNGIMYYVSSIKIEKNFTKGEE